jgi:hypothetical protein
MRICGQRERAFRCRDGCKIRLRVWEFLELARNQLSERAIADVERDVLREKGVRTFDDLACKHDGPGPPAPSVLRTQHATTPVTPSRRPGQLSTTTRVATAGEPVNVYDISNDSSDSDHGSASPSVNANRNRGQEPSSSGPSTAPVASAQSASTSSGAHQTAARSPADSATDRFTHTAAGKRRAEVASHRDEPPTRRQTRSTTANGESTHDAMLRGMTAALLATPDVLDQLTTALSHAHALLAGTPDAATAGHLLPVATAAAAIIAAIELQTPRAS